MSARFPFLDMDLESEARRVAASMRDIVVQRLRRRGVIVAMSGGIDSSVSAALAVQAFGPERVLGLMLPERDSSPAAERLARQLAGHLGIQFLVEDISAALEGFGCYRRRDEAIRQVFPEYTAGWRNKIVIAGGHDGGMNFFRLVVQTPSGEQLEARLPVGPYLQIVAATNFKQRTRKTFDYYHADRLNYAVVGTPNRVEYDQGFFVKLGDGAADVKPIAHLYKSQVYAMARHLGLPQEVCNTMPTTDTYSLPQGQDEFYFALPYEEMDVALWAINHGWPAAELARWLSIDERRAQKVLADIEAKRRTTAYLHASALLVDRPAELGPYRLDN